MYSESTNSLSFGLRELDSPDMNPWIPHNTICWLINNSVLSVSKHVGIHSHLHLPLPSLNKLGVLSLSLAPLLSVRLHVSWLVRSQVCSALWLSIYHLCLCAQSHWSWITEQSFPVNVNMSCVSSAVCGREVAMLVDICWCVSLSLRMICPSLQAPRRIKGMDLIKRYRACGEVSGGVLWLVGFSRLPGCCVWRQQCGGGHPHWHASHLSPAHTLGVACPTLFLTAGLNLIWQGQGQHTGRWIYPQSLSSGPLYLPYFLSWPNGLPTSSSVFKPLWVFYQRPHSVSIPVTVSLTAYQAAPKARQAAFWVVSISFQSPDSYQSQWPWTRDDFQPRA